MVTVQSSRMAIVSDVHVSVSNGRITFWISCDQPMGLGKAVTGNLGVSLIRLLYAYRDQVYLCLKL